MKASKFSDAQKAFILKQGSDARCRWRISAAVRQGSAAGHVFQLEAQNYGRPAADRDAAAEAA